MLSALDSLAIRLDPSLLMDELGFEPDDWQRQLLRSDSEKLVLNCHRQAGKSSATAALAVHTAVFQDDSLTLLISRSLRQSGELFKKVSRFYAELGCPHGLIEDNATTLALGNGSRVVCLPGSAETVVGYSAPQLVVIDEASRTPDELFLSLAPMLAISRGRLLALSTPYGKRGWWHQQWTDAGPPGSGSSSNAGTTPGSIANGSRSSGGRWARDGSGRTSSV